MPGVSGARKLEAKTDELEWAHEALTVEPVELASLLAQLLARRRDGRLKTTGAVTVVPLRTGAPRVALALTRSILHVETSHPAALATASHFLGAHRSGVTDEEREELWRVLEFLGVPVDDPQWRIEVSAWFEAPCEGPPSGHKIAGGPR